MIKNKEKDVLLQTKGILSKEYGNKEKYIKNFELFLLII